MNIEIITDLISKVGFPIAVCLVCFWYINQKDKKHETEIKSLSEAINNNTLVMQKIVDKLGAI